MQADEFIDTVNSPDAWFRQSIALSRAGKLLWDEIIGKVFGYEFWQDDMQAAQLLYSLSIETALKGRILKNCPDKVELVVAMNGQREVTSARLNQFGTKMNDGHNLEKLAEIAGIVQSNGNADRRELLRYAAECIRWRSRYPVPLSVTKNSGGENYWVAESGKHFFGFAIEIIKELVPQACRDQVSARAGEL